MKKQHYEQHQGKQISKEDIVCAVMEQKQNITKTIKGRDVVHRVFICPRGEYCTKVDGVNEFPAGSGFTNPHNHLISCLCGGNEIEVEDHYWNATSQFSILSPPHKGGKQSKQSKLQFGAKAKPRTEAYHILNQREKDMFAWVVMIVMEHIPISSVENVNYRSFAQPNTHFGTKTVRRVILAMTVFIEQVLAAEIASAGKLSIVHDAWSKFGEHYFALFATYKATRRSVVNGVVTDLSAPVISLLSVAPLHTPTVEINDGYLPLAEEAEVQESCEFTAEAHKNHIIHILSEYYNVDVDTKVTNQTADSASVNLALARLLGIPHVNCENHLLNNEVKIWTVTSTEETISHSARSFNPGSVIKVIHDTMASLKTNKNRAVLRHVGTDLAPTIPVQTRWGSNHNMMQKYEKMHAYIDDAHDHDDSDIVMPPTTNAFNKAVKNTASMLADINNVAVVMQTSMATVARCAEYQDVLIKLSDEGREDICSPWYRNTFGKLYIDPESIKRPNKAFVSAVKKTTNEGWLNSY